MREVIRLVQDIRSFLSGTPGSPPAEALAPTYARFREEAANRLEACAAMLEKGSDYQVLQLAETEPPLLDMVADLSFAEEPKWVAHCGEHQLSVPRPIDAKAVQALNNIYNKGISANSPLYRDYRAAVSSRNEDKAFQIIRSIARLNPSDADAKAELERVRNKKMLAKLEDLKPLLAAGDRDAVTTLVEEIEELSTEDKLTRHEVYNEAAAIRKDVMRKRGERESATLLDTSEQQKKDGDWKGVSVNVTRIRSLENERQIVFTPDQAGRLAALERYVERQREDAREQVEFNRVLSAFSNYAEKVDTRLLTAATLTLTEAQQLEAGFAEQWKKVELYQREVPAGELARLQGIGAAIRLEAGRLRGAKAAKRFSLAAMVTLLLCASAWAGYATWRAYQYVEQLEGLYSRKMAGAAGKLVEEIPGTAPWGATAVPALSGKMEEIRQWAKNEQKHMDLTESLLADLEKAGGDQYAGMEAAVLRQKVAATSEHVQRLAADLNTSKDRLAQVQNKVDQHFTALREKATTNAETQIAELSKLAEVLSFERPGTELSSALAAIDPKLQEIEKQLGGEIPELRMPPEIEAAANKLRGQVAPFLKELAELRRITQAMTDADTLDDYKAALLDYSKLRIVEAGASAPMLANFPSPDWMASEILFGGNVSSWEAVKKDTTTGSTFRPDEVLNEELKELLSLRDDPMLNQIWEVVVTKLQTEKSRMVWSKGKPNETTNSIDKRWAGSFYDPADMALKPVFIDGNIIMKQISEGKRSGEFVASIKPNANQRFMASLKINRITDPNGDHFETPLLQVLDGVLQSTEGSVLAKAYVYQRICRIIKIRPYPWGLHYCPVLVEDMTKLNTLLYGRSLHSDDWMVPDVRTRLEPALTLFLKGAASHPPYLTTAGNYRQLAIAVRTAGINYVGYLDDNLQPHVKSKGIAASRLCAIAERGGAPINLPFENGQAKPNALKSAQKWSPLFLIPIDYDEATGRIRSSAGAGFPVQQTQPGNAPKSPSPFKTPVENSASSSPKPKTSPSEQANADREINRRLQHAHEAEVAIGKGDKYYTGGNYEQALSEYKTALDLLPEAPATQALRDAATVRYCDAAVELARQRAKSGRYDDSRTLLKDALARKPDHATALTLFKQLANAGAAEPQNINNTANAERALMEKMQRITFPLVQFTACSVEEIVEFLRIKSKELDTMERDPAKRGVNIILRQGAAPSTAAITLELRDVPMVEVLRYVTELAGMKFRVEPFAVLVVPVSDVGTELFTRTFKAPPDFLSFGVAAGGAAPPDPFASKVPRAGSGRSSLPTKETAMAVLVAAGIPFPDGASATFISATSQLIVKNTQPNLDAVEAFVNSLLKNRTR